MTQDVGVVCAAYAFKRRHVEDLADDTRLYTIHDYNTRLALDLYAARAESTVRTNRRVEGILHGERFGVNEKKKLNK